MFPVLQFIFVVVVVDVAFRLIIGVGDDVLLLVVVAVTLFAAMDVAVDVVEAAKMWSLDKIIKHI